MDFAIRPMRPEDIPQVADIEREAFPTTWPPTPFRRELGNKLARYLVARAERDSPAALAASPAAADSPSLVVRLMDGFRNLFGEGHGVPAEPAMEDLMGGYVGIWFVLDEAHIISIAVRASLRRMGVGELLTMAAVELAMARRAKHVTLETRVSNYPAQALYEKYGFQRVGLRKAYYSDNNEDAYIMTVESILSPAYQEKFQALVDAFSQRRGQAARILA
ncbi:MAG: ribosomal protein S18-alanine N-acetyltransferase [Chloroflexi bacterium]|nr:ribosomal protein S18-alanine N-acetyltransferase [Chloroflexota bacterium]